MEYKRPSCCNKLCAYLQTNYILVHMPRQSTVIGFGNAVLYAFIHKSASVRFFECAANSAGEKDCIGKAKPRARGAKPVTLFY